jgi:hypothetical protein
VDGILQMREMWWCSLIHVDAHSNGSDREQKMALSDRLIRFIGYGNPKADFWFLGMEGPLETLHDSALVSSAFSATL